MDRMEELLWAVFEATQEEAEARFAQADQDVKIVNEMEKEFKS
jgi:hypothetical protein